MNKIAAGFAGIVLAVSLTACGDGDSETPTVTETVTVTPETEIPEAPTEAPVPTEVPDSLFASIVRDNTNAFDGDTDADIVAAAKSVCDFWDSGATMEDVFNTVVDSGVDVEDGGFLVGAGTEAYCPEHTSKIDQFLNNNA